MFLDTPCKSFEGLLLALSYSNDITWGPSLSLLLLSTYIHVLADFIFTQAFSFVYVGQPTIPFFFLFWIPL